MTYLSFLIGFVLTPIMLLLLWLLYQRWKGSWRPFLISFPINYSFLLLAAMAVLYTTPWDNYLVATRVWWYDPALVLGATIGWVPVEEYLFFMLQPVLGGLLLLYLFSRIPTIPQGQSNPELHELSQDEFKAQRFRRWSVGIALMIWSAALFSLMTGYPETTYLGLELVWALPVIILQLAFGADIVWPQRRNVVLAILVLTIYLSAADALAIQSGVWTINPQKSLGLLLGGKLPVEEYLFFLLTNMMVAFGFVLIWAPQSRARLKSIWNGIRSRNRRATLQQDL